jgi:hypothetical protein
MPIVNILEESCGYQIEDDYITHTSAIVITARNKYSARSHDTMRLVSVKLPEALIDGLEDLVKSAMYPSRSAAIRTAIRDMLKQELWRV